MNQSLAKLTPRDTLSQIISVDEQAGQLLKSIGVNASSHKDETLQAVCQQYQWSETEVLQWIKKNCKTQRSEIDSKNNSKKAKFADSLSGWCDYIEDEIMPVVTNLINKIEADFPRIHQVHGNQYPWLKDMQWYFDQFRETLKMYYIYEQIKFYPLIKKLDNHKGEMLDGTVNELKRSLDIIQKDQQSLQDNAKAVREKTQEFKNPGGACSTLPILN